MKNTVTGARRVLIIENELLLGAGIETLLANEIDLTVKGVSPADKRALLKIIRNFQPDVIILDSYSLLVNPIQLLAQLPEFPQLRVFSLSGEDNQVTVFSKYQATVIQTADLLQIIKHSPNLAQPGIQPETEP